MRLVLDTNILISALIKRSSTADSLYNLWKLRKFDLVSSERQLAEFKEATRKPKLAPYINPWQAGEMVNEIREMAVMQMTLSIIDLSSDPNDNFILAMAVAGKADYLVTGDKRHLLNLGRIEQTRIIALSEIIKSLGH